MMHSLEYIVEKEFANIDYSKSKFVIAEYENCRFIKCNFSNSKLIEAIFINCEFENCEFSNCNISSTVFRDVNFSKCNLSGLEFNSCNQLLISFSFNECKINLASFFGMKLHKTEFIKCIFREVDFGRTDLTASSFDDCDLSQTIFDNSTLSKCDFRKAINYSIDPEQNRISKAKFSVAGLPGLLNKYDIVIE